MSPQKMLVPCGGGEGGRFAQACQRACAKFVATSEIRGPIRGDQSGALRCRDFVAPGCQGFVVGRINPRTFGACFGCAHHGRAGHKPMRTAEVGPGGVVDCVARLGIHDLTIEVDAVAAPPLDVGATPIGWGPRNLAEQAEVWYLSACAAAGS